MLFEKVDYLSPTSSTLWCPLHCS
jgi:hypothetical protein